MQGLQESEKIRLRNFEDSKLDPFQAKYGLFSFAGTLAIQPHAYEQVKGGRKDKDGNVRISPRNICASPTKVGKTPDSYFSMPGFVSIGDAYKDPKPTFSDSENSKKLQKFHDSPFKLPGPFELKSTFEHVSELKPKKRTKSTVPRNFYTSPTKKGSPNCTPGITFNEYEHLPSPKVQMKLNKIVEKSEKFKPSSNYSELFEKNIYKFDGVLPNKILKKLDKKQGDGIPFKPSSPCKKNLPDALFGFAEYIPPRVDTPKLRSKKAETPLPWKATTKEFSMPVVPTAMMPLNIRKEFKIIN